MYHLPHKKKVMPFYGKKSGAILFSQHFHSFLITFSLSFFVKNKKHGLNQSKA